MKDIKIFLKKKKTKGKERSKKDIRFLLKKEKKTSVIRIFRRNKKRAEYRKKYYLTHKKQLLRDFLDFLRILGQLKKIH